MKTGGNSEARRGGRQIALLMAMLIATLTAFPVTATADHRHRRDRDDERHRGVVYREVPRRLDYRVRREYQPYYAGRVYYRPHHHHHRAYHLPVFVHGVVVHRPFYYCSDRIFLAAAVPLPRLALRIEFGAPDVVYEPNYPPPPRYKHHDHDDCDDDEYEEDDD